MQIIPVVFSTDDYYVLPLMVAMNSLKRNKSEDVLIKTFILTESLKEENKNKLKSLQGSDFTIDFINVTEYVDEGLYSKERFPVAMYFRFFIPLIFKDYSKVIYLDCDVVVNKCISKLYNCDIGDNYLGMCIDCYGLKRSDDYYNSGILVFNIAKQNEDEVPKKCVEYVQNNPALCLPDQDTINAVCKGKIYCLSSIYNYMTTASYDRDNGVYNKKKALSVFGVEKEENIVIYHFTDNYKPWVTRNAPYAKVWWKNAKLLPKQIYKEINDYSKLALKKGLQDYKIALEKNYCFNRFFNYYTKTKLQRVKIWIKGLFSRKK